MQRTNAVAALITLALLGPNVSGGQAAAKIEFQAASIRSSPPRSPREEKPVNGVRSGGPGTTDPRQVTYARVPLDQIVADAFDLTWDRVAGPGWMVTERYDIAAKVPQGSTPDQELLMLQNLLMERMRLIFHVQTKVFAGYELAVAAGGSKLKESAIDSKAGRTMPELTQYLGTRLGTQFVPGPIPGIKRIKPAAVVDKTGLTGRYDFAFDSGRRGMPSALDLQLGLKLVEAKVRVDILVIDHIEKTPAGD